MRGVDPKVQDDRANSNGFGLGLFGVAVCIVAGIGRVIFG